MTQVNSSKLPYKGRIKFILEGKLFWFIGRNPLNERYFTYVDNHSNVYQSENTTVIIYPCRGDIYKFKGREFKVINYHNGYAFCENLKDGTMFVEKLDDFGEYTLKGA